MKLRKIPDSVEKYVYEPLDLTKHQIRLLVVKPSVNSDDPVECDVKVFDMDDAPYYVTLSYVWGEADSIRYMILDGRRIRIRKNLFDFLLCFRDDPSNVHYLWIDQLCIAQTLDLERNHQVRLMSRIYKRCLYVIMWLGAAAFQHAVAFNTTPTKASAYELFYNPYFGRLWVVQEILLAPQIRVFCGWNNEELAASYTTISDPHDYVTAMDRPGHITSETMIEDLFVQKDPIEDAEITVEKVWVQLDAVVSVLRCSDMREYPRFFDSVLGNPDILPDPRLRRLLSLATCITRFSKYECSNPRDKVYGLLGLVIEEQRPIVDYSKSKEEVIADVLMIMARLQWEDTRESPFIPRSTVRTQYWLDVVCLTGLANDMGLAEQCHPISYVMIEVYETIASAKSKGEPDFPIEAIGHRSNDESGNWWFRTKGGLRYLLDWPRMPAWTKMGLNVLASGVPERFQPYPSFHFDGTPWIQPEKESSGRVLAKSLLDHETLSRMLAKEKTGVDVTPIRLEHGSGTITDPHYEPAPVSLPIRTKRLR